MKPVTVLALVMMSSMLVSAAPSPSSKKALLEELLQQIEVSKEGPAVIERGRGRPEDLIESRLLMEPEPRKAAIIEGPGRKRRPVASIEDSVWGYLEYYVKCCEEGLECCSDLKQGSKKALREELHQQIEVSKEGPVEIERGRAKPARIESRFLRKPVPRNTALIEQKNLIGKQVSSEDIWGYLSYYVKCCEEGLECCGDLEQEQDDQEDDLVTAQRLAEEKVKKRKIANAQHSLALCCALHLSCCGE